MGPLRIVLDAIQECADPPTHYHKRMRSVFYWERNARPNAMPNATLAWKKNSVCLEIHSQTTPIKPIFWQPKTRISA